MILSVFEIIGTLAFAISGACVGIEYKMDIFGVAMLGMTTAVGGGVFRDLILGVTPPVAFGKPLYALLSIAVSLVVFLPKVRVLFKDLNRPFYIVIDSLGLAAFTVVGVRAGMKFDNAFLSVFVGVLTGVGGGVLRDIFAGKQPDIFRKRFYACASIIGAFITVALWKTGLLISMTSGAAVVFILRLLAAKYKWNLPRA